ncbi:hypothetical protein XM38_038720 [Halomicronema hongdechloris C2206]|uniref:Uncharacterized protein n=2 Tax=Halomicronema hongdechloris TaxID=1209493 RepID=A0A1Z3HRN8_9CYAN|nr:hypothetical protein XM38_038720 [Halomicronema hongdechloris C2206]
MLPYIICFAIGGVFVLLSALGGLDGVDFGDLDTADLDAAELDTADLDTAAIEAEVDDIDAGTHALTADQTRRFARPPKRLWLPVLSFRFWTFGLCFFGLTGLLLTWLQPDLPVAVIGAIATLMGILCGSLAAWILRLLGTHQANSMTTSDSLVGLIGTVEIPFDAHSRGKVRLSLKGSTIGFFAFTQEDRAFQPGETVLVVGLENNKLWVVSCEELKSPWLGVPE